MQEKVEIITNHFEHYWTKKPKNGHCDTVRKNCSSDRENFLKFEAEGREFAKILRSQKQFIRTVKGQKKFLVTECFFYLFLEVSQIQ